MTEIDINFEDYLSEFNGTVPFDSEICPVCGIKISDSITVSNSPFVDLFSSANEKEIESVSYQLSNYKIEFRIYKEIDKSNLSEVRYIYRIVVMIKDMEAAKKVIEDLSTS